MGGIAAAALLALPAGAAASQGGQVNSLTAQQCNQERADIGKRAFRKRYGAKHPMRACVRRTRPEVDNAMAECIAEDTDEILNPEDHVDEGEDDGSDG
jgi:hypothetical protein